MARHTMFMQLWLQGSSDITLSGFSFMGGGSFGSFGGSGFGGMNSMLAMQSGQSAEREIQSINSNININHTQAKAGSGNIEGK